MNDVSSEKIGKLMRKGEYKKAIEIIDLTIQNEDIEEVTRLSHLCQKCTSLNSLGRYEEALRDSRNLQKESHESEILLHQVNAILEEIFALYRLNKFDNISSIFKNTENLIDKLNNPEKDKKRAQLLVNIVYIHTALGEVEQANVYAQQNYYLS